MPLGELTIGTDSDGCSSEFPWGCNQVDVEWNQRSGEFGVLYTEGPQKILARVLPSGIITGRTALGLPAMYGNLAVNAANGNYLAISAGSPAGSTTRTPIEGAEVSPGGVLGIVRQASSAPSSSINTACPWGPCF